MSFGHSSAMRFDVNHHSGAPGVFWQKNQPKPEKRKFGYKSKGLRHEIRRPDNAELIEEFEKKKEEEQRKFNRDNKDFIQKNRGRYKPREQVPPPGSTHITPGTVTLTQDQLAALLTSLGTLNNKGDGKADNPLKISFDTDTNKIEVQRYESDDGGDGDEQVNGGGGGNSPALGIYDLLGDGDVVPKSEKKERRAKTKTRGNETDAPRRREESKAKDDSPVNTARSTLEEAKREAGVAHVTPAVPLKHMTVGERKRLQWAMERAELEKEYDPWGRPGAGAPPGKTEEAKVERKTASQFKDNEADLKAKHRQQREDLESDIERLRREILDAEKQKEEEEQIIVNRILEEKQKKESKSERRREKDESGAERGKRNDGGRRRDVAARSDKQQRKDRDDSQTRNENVVDNGKVQIVFVTKKKGKKDTEKEEISITLNTSELNDASDGDIDDNTKESKSQIKSRKSRRDKDVTELPQESTKERETTTKKESREDEKKKEDKADAKLLTKKAVVTDDEEETAHLSQKEIERRKWVAELNKQRDEQRLKKQMEKERDKAGVQDQWADRFVYHKSPVQTSPRRGQVKPSPREEVPGLGRAPESRTVQFDAPAAMRSSMVVGAGTLNETRFDSKKADEKRQWLEELDRQREEKRQLMAARKERERQEDGIWADRYPTDRHKINQFAQSNKSPRPAGHAEPMDSHRVSSAPEPAVTVRAGAPTLNLGVGDSQEDQPTTFLRGQGVHVDPVTRKEQEEKRRLHMEYQAEIKRQIEEKERQKREEKERKAREDMEEERKFQTERDRVLKQQEAEKRMTKDKEAMQQKHLASLKTAMEDAEERAKEEKNLRRIQHLQQRGHDVAQLKATYEATTPRLKEFDSAGIPGLAQSSSSPLPSEQVFVPALNHNQPPTVRDNAYHHNHPAQRGTAAGHHYHQPSHPIGQSYTKEPYVEDRVLTPSRHRDPSRPRDDPNSPKREFGTQTLELKDLQSILSSLPDDIQIEYKMKVEEALKGKQEKKPPAPTRKVHSKSADARNAKAGNTKPTAAANAAAMRKEQGEMRERRVASKERNSKIGERPQWGQRKVKAVTKNSEKDPFYQQKKEESEARKAKRERQLQYLQELNKERIPNLSPSRARAASPDQGGDRERGRGRDPRGGVRHGRRDASNSKQQRGGSPNILTVAHDLEPSKNHHGKGGGGVVATTGRSSSPPLPTVKHNTVSRNNDNYYNDDNDPYYYTNNVLKNSQSEGRYEDLTAAKAAPVHDGDFIPFTRTTEILDPARADEPLAISREHSRMERARRAYHETRQPANRGKQLNVLQDRERESALRTNNNPILNPHLVTDHPTGRQDQILQQLSSLKQNLMQRRKELENYMEPEL